MNSNKNQKQILYRESKLTQLLQSCLQSSCFVNLISTLTPSESNYEECLSSLQVLISQTTSKFLDRTKNIQIKGQQISSIEQDKTPVNVQQEKVIRKMTDENNELKERIENIQKEYKQKLKDLQKILGIDIDIDKLNSKSNTKEINQFKQQREALIKADNIQKRNENNELKIETLMKEIEQQKKEDTMKQEKYSCQILELKEQNRKLKDQITVVKMSHEDGVRQLNHEREQLIRRMIEKSNIMLEEKVNNIVNLPQAVQTKTNENQKLQDVKKTTKIEAEKEFKILLEQIRVEYHKLMLASKEQVNFQSSILFSMNFISKKKTQNQKTFYHNSKNIERKKSKNDLIYFKRNQQSEMKYEMIDMYDIIFKQQRVIDKIEAGGYSAGIKSFNIPQKDKPLPPTRQKHPKYLFFVQHCQLIQISRQQKCFISNEIIISRCKIGNLQQYQEELNKRQANIRSSQQKPTLVNQSQNKEEIRINIGQSQSNLYQSQLNDHDIHKMDLSNLRNYTQQLKEQLELENINIRFIGKFITKNKDRNPVGFRMLPMCQQLLEVQYVYLIFFIERDELKQLYANEIKKYNQARITLESQKRLLGKLQADEPQVRIRPMSSVQKNKIKMPK